MSEQKSNALKRLAGNKLPVNAVIATVRGTVATVQLPMNFSHWGDNNPIEPLNVRGRDVLTLGLAAGISDVLPVDGVIDGIIGGIAHVDPAGFLATHGAHMIVHIGLGTLVARASEAHGKARQNASIEWHVTNPSTDGFWGLETTAVHMFQLSVCHKLFEEHAKLEPVRMPSFRKLTLAKGIVSTGPGWFCPYVYSTHRQPLVSRINEISFVQLREPIIAADQILAFQLVGFFKSIFGRLISFANSSPTFQPPKTPSTSRALVCIAGISPFRGIWSQGRRPGQCKMWFHVMNGVPGIAIPVVDSSPLLAWHGKDLGELKMQDLAEVFQYVSTLLDPAYQIDTSMLNAALECMIGNAIAGRKAAKKLNSDFDLDRTGILVIKYGTAAVTV